MIMRVLVLMLLLLMANACTTEKLNVAILVNASVSVPEKIPESKLILLHMQDAKSYEEKIQLLYNLIHLPYDTQKAKSLALLASQESDARIQEIAVVALSEYAKETYDPEIEEILARWNTQNQDKIVEKAFFFFEEVKASRRENYSTSFTSQLGVALDPKPLSGGPAKITLDFLPPRSGIVFADIRGTGACTECELLVAGDVAQYWYTGDVVANEQKKIERTISINKEGGVIYLYAHTFYKEKSLLQSVARAALVVTSSGTLIFT